MQVMTSSFVIWYHMYTKIINAEIDCINMTLLLTVQFEPRFFLIHRFINNDDILTDISIATLLSVKHNGNSF